jgi:hypothetical protein
MASAYRSEDAEAAGPAHAGRRREDQQWTGKEARRGRASEVLAPTIAKLQEAGFVSISAIARELRKQEIATAQGGKWRPTGVKRLLLRLEKLKLVHRS